MEREKFLIDSVIAHRGVHYKYMENTILAFQEAIDRKYTIELDVQFTKDKELIVFHDSNLKRIFDINREIGDMTLVEIRKFRYIPTLEEVLKLVNGRVPVMIDIKYNRGIEKKIANILDDYEGDFSIQSFNLLPIFWFKINRPKYILGCLIYKFLYLRRVLCILKPNYIATNLNNLKKVSKYRDKYIILGYTLKNKKEYQKYKTLADNFICDIQR